MAPAIRFRSAVALLDRFPVLSGVDLDVAPGEILLVRGPNGAGKTSLLRACAGLVPVVGGEATVLGHDLRRDRRSVRREVALLGHNAGLYDDLNVRENVTFAVRASRGWVAEVATALERTGLAGRLAEVPAARLSAGQRRRAALAVVLARRPALWLLDEPHAGLDEAGRNVLDDAARQHAAGGGTVVFASHEDDRAAVLATRVVQMRGGRAEEAARVA